MQYLGMLAGILNRFGKIGVIIGFVLGNAVLAYISNGNTMPIIAIREILIASLGLLFIPKRIEIDITDIIGNVKYFPVTGGVLDGQKDTVSKLNNVSETISEMARGCENGTNINLDTEEEFKIECKESFKDELLNNLEDCEDNMFYDEIIDNMEEIFDDIYFYVDDNKEITKDRLTEILEENNNTILGINNADDEMKKKTEDDIEQIVKIINYTYRINQLNLVWKYKEASRKKSLATQLRRCFKSNIITCRRYRRKSK